MTLKDQQKLLRAGFTLIRSDQHNLRIKFRGSPDNDWRTLENGFKSKAALKRKMDELLKLSTFIEE